MKHFITLLIAILLAAGSVEAAKPKKKQSKAAQPVTSQSIKQQQKQNAKLMQQTDEQIKATNRQITNQLNQLNLVEGQIKLCDDSISVLNNRIAEIDSATVVVTDSINQLTERLDNLRSALITSLRSARVNRGETSKLQFLFSADSFMQAFRRVRALNQFANWRLRRADEIAEVVALLDDRKLYLDTLADEARHAASQLVERQAALKTHKAQADKLITDLRSRDKQLHQVLKDQQAKAARLDAELNRIIAEEQRRAAEAERQRQAELERQRQAELERQRRAEQAKANQQKDITDDKSKKSKDKPAKTETKPKASQPAQPSGELAMNNVPTTPPAAVEVGATFASSRGKLPAPVDGRYTVVKPFGRQRHPAYPNLEIDNAGIDIQTTRGATVRCVYDGKVSAVFCPDQVTNVVVVRHGDYVTVYANLGSLSVKKGDTVKKGQALGSVYVDTDDDNRSVLHFEIRNGANPSNVRKENPQTWIR
ncbi:MAG: peptidoglycan DD-metalloendopeptidase family protein [Muribaculaceae bacterium]|nr:peptidoglycan DD-metalloendopeptidase family protein [Muribaculaceae bacterium]